MTAKKTNTYGDLNSVKKEVERIYSQIGTLEKERAKWDKMGDKKRVKYYDDLIKDNEHKIKTFQKVISDVEKMTAKKTAKKASTTKKTSGTTRTKGLHQTGTQTLEGRKMDLKIKAELPGKRTSATGKTYYEYRVNRTDMPTEREDFEKLFGKVKRAPKAEKKTSSKKTASGTAKKTAEAIKAELYSTRSMLLRDKQELRRLYELLHINEVERERWERMGDKKRVKYYIDLIKETKAEILKYNTKIIPALENEIAKLEKEKKTLETKKTSGTPAKKKASGTASASKSSAKKKQVKSRKTRKTSKTQKTLF